MAIAQITGPAVEPVSTAEFKLHAKIEETEDDTLISDFIIPTARGHVEEITRRQLISSQYRLTLLRFPRNGVITLPSPPLITVDSIQYVDTDGDTQTLTTDDYTVHTDDIPGIVTLDYNKDWPSTLGHVYDVTITFTAGYGTLATDVPEQLRHAINVLGTDLYEHREDTAMNLQNFEIKNSTRAICYPYIIHETINTTAQ